MTPTDRRTARVLLWAEIDQQTARAEDGAFKPDLSREERELAVVQLEFRRRAAEQVERLLLRTTVIEGR